MAWWAVFLVERYSRLPGACAPMASAGGVWGFGADDGVGWGGGGGGGRRRDSLSLLRSVLAGESHVQFEREDREAQWREAGRVRVRHFPGKRGPLQALVGCTCWDTPAGL